ncbi:MAG: hypothetical protein D8M59_01150 [Planctomycetes bacterium]|nr:hypothetical protein [Planctomycetota bacterium]NOG54672.1 hypothetical protein [Planctomycetota bacterium]
MSRSMDLTIRRFERNDIVLDALLEVDESQREQVVFSSSNPQAANAHTLKVTLADVGDGGVGIQTSVFLPRGLKARVRVMAPRLESQDGETANQRDPQGEATTEVLFEHGVQVRRVELTSRIPTFFIGMSFENAAPDMSQQVEAFMARASEVFRAVNMARLEAMERGDVA